MLINQCSIKKKLTIRKTRFVYRGFRVPHIFEIKIKRAREISNIVLKQTFRDVKYFKQSLESKAHKPPGCVDLRKNEWLFGVYSVWYIQVTLPRYFVILILRCVMMMKNFSLQSEHHIKHCVFAYTDYKKSSQLSNSNNTHSERLKKYFIHSLCTRMNLSWSWQWKIESMKRVSYTIDSYCIYTQHHITHIIHQLE